MTYYLCVTMTMTDYLCVIITDYLRVTMTFYLYVTMTDYLCVTVTHYVYATMTDYLRVTVTDYLCVTLRDYLYVTMTDYLQPYKARPETSASVARSLVAGALGLQARVSREQRQLERQRLKEAQGGSVRPRGNGIAYKVVLRGPRLVPMWTTVREYAISIFDQPHFQYYTKRLAGKNVFEMTYFQ